MADSDVLKLAKGLVVFDTKDLDDIFNDCETPALLLLAKYISKESLSEYVNKQTVNYTSAEIGSEPYLTKLNIDYSKNINTNDLIVIPTNELTPRVYSGVYVVENKGDDYIEIRTEFSVTETGTIINKSNDNILYAHAYLILHCLSLHAQSVVKKDVIYSSQQFGQGTIAPASMNEKKLLGQRYLDRALTYVGNIKAFSI